MNVINHVILDNIQIIKVVSVEKKLIDKLVKKYSEENNGNKLIYNATLNDYVNVCNSCTIYIALLVIVVIIIISIRYVYNVCSYKVLVVHVSMFIGI